METVKTIKNTIKKWPVRSAAVLTVALITVILLGQFVFATGTNPIRTVHKVAAGDMTYCFSVQKNVVIPVSELSGIGDDEELTMAVLERAGLYIQESGCRNDEHPPITIDEWLKAGNTLSLSDEDLALIRNASPSEGRPVKLYLDVYFTLQYDEDKAKEEQGDVSGNASEEQEEPAGPEGDTSGNAGEDDPAEGSQDEPQNEPQDEPYERPVYSTFKLTSPELLFVVIATDADAEVPEDECEDETVPEIPEEPEFPEFPEIDMDIDIPDVPEDMLPEYRKIEMKDKSGAPLPSVLEDGEPYELIWIEPQKGIDVETAKGWIEKFPGGAWGFGGACGSLAAIGIGIWAIVRKKRRDDDY